MRALHNLLRLLPLSPSIALAIILSSCAVSRIGGATATIHPTDTVNPIFLPVGKTQTLPPAKTPITTPISTPTVENSPQPSPSALPGTPPLTPTCFTPRDTNFFAFMPDSVRILVRAANGVQILNLKTGQEESFIQAPQNIVAAALSPDGQTLAWSLEDHSIQLIRVADKKLLSTMHGHTGMVGKLKFSPSGDRLYSASHDTWVRIWDLSGKQLGAFQPTGADNFPSEVLGIGISPDGTQLATVPGDGPVKLWDLAHQKLIAELGGSGGYDTSDVAFSPDGQLIASDLATGLSLWRTSDHALLLSGINSMAFAFSPEGHYLAYEDIANGSKGIIASPDGSQQVRTLEGLDAPIWELVFSPDGALLGSAGSEIRIWRVADGSLAYVGKADCP